jgi:hypothetical protein
VLHPPGRDLALEGAELSFLVAARMALTQQAEECRALERRIALKLSGDPGPVLVEGVGTGAVTPWLFDLARKLAQLLVPPSGPGAHPRSGGSLFLGLALGALALH